MKIGSGEIFGRGTAKIWLLQLAGNAVLLGAIYFWLVIPDAKVWQVLGSLVSAIVIVFCALWLHGGTMAWPAGNPDTEPFGLAYRRALRHLASFFLWVIILGAAVWILSCLRIYPPQFGVWFWKKLPAFLQNISTPRGTGNVADWVLWFCLWFIVPLLWLPLAIRVASSGLRNSVFAWRLLKRPAYWVALAALLTLGAFVPSKLIWWIPSAGTLTAQAWSMGVRFAVAYVIAVTAWVALIATVGWLLRAEITDSPKGA